VLVWLPRSWPTPFERHPDVRALARYGDPLAVAAAVEAEMADPGQVFHFADLEGSLVFRRGLPRWLNAGEIYLSPSWLVHAPAHTCRRADVLRLHDVVWVSRTLLFPGKETAHPTRPGPVILVIDRHDARAVIPGGDAALSALMAELLARVPWALDRFDAE